MSYIYLKLESEVKKTGHIENDTCLSIELNSHSLNLGKTAPDYKEVKGCFHGTKLTGGDYYSPRKKISFTYTIKGKYSDPNSVYHRIKTIIDAEENVYFYQKYPDKVVYAKGKIPGDSKAEIWNNLLCSEKLEMSIPIEDPFFYNVAEKEITFSKVIINNIEIEINRDGKETPFLFDFTFETGADSICVKLHDDVKFEYERTFIPGDTIKVNSADLTIYINGLERKDIFPKKPLSSPFNILYKTSYLKLQTTATGTGKVVFRERYSR